MIKNADGISVLKYALRRARLRVFTGDELIPTQELLGVSSFCAQKGWGAACIIDERETTELEYLADIRDSHNTTILVVVIGNQINQKFMHKMRAYNIPTFLPHNLMSLMEMVGTGTLYSKIKNVPCVVYISRRLLMAIESVNLDGICGDRSGSLILGLEAAENILYEIESRCMKIEGSGDVAIIASDYAYQIVRHLVIPKSLIICNVGMVNPFIIEDIPFANKYILLGPLAAYFFEYFSNAEVIESTLNPLDDGEIIESELKKILSKKHGENFAELGSRQESLSVKKPDIPRRDNAMCGGCNYKFEQLKYLEERKIKRENAYEDIFCEVLGTCVSSGVANAKNFYSADIIFVNYKSKKYNAKRVVRLKNKCTLNFDLRKKFFIDKSLCDSCMECKELTECSAIYKQGLCMYIDQHSCNGCGKCEFMCKRHAIKETTDG